MAFLSLENFREGFEDFDPFFKGSTYCSLDGSRCLIHALRNQLKEIEQSLED